VLQELESAMIAPNRLSAALISACAGFGLLLATLGIYGVIAFAIAQRTRELAIRVAFGAPRAALFRSVLLRGAGMAGIGVGLGAIGTVALQRVLGSFLFELSPFDAVSFTIACGTLLSVALLACWLPAWRATRADPMVALRAE
jgi:ABC-type antimicrobial peptide transport system permease subunit